MTTEHERRLIREYGLQAREQFPERDWTCIGPMLQRLWDNDTRHTSRWEDVEPLMHLAWSAHAGAMSSPVLLEKAEES
jgi:hypothetical protein